MLLTPKKPKSSCKDSDCKDKECDEKKEDTQKETCKKDQKCKDKEKCKKIDEAETKATGDDLKLRIQKTVAQVFNFNKDKVELTDVPNCIPGYNVYYFKLSFNENKKDSNEESQSKEN